MTSLIATILRMEFDAPATNVTVPRNLAIRTEDMVLSLENNNFNGEGSQNNHVLEKSSSLYGLWRLLYLNGPKITSLASRLPLGFMLGRKVSFRKVLIPKLDPNVKALPANDITYLDDTIQVTWGGDRALFIFERAPEVKTLMLTVAERESLLSDGKRRANNNNKVDVIVGGKKEFLNGQPELKFLFSK